MVLPARKDGNRDANTEVRRQVRLRLFGTDHLGERRWLSAGDVRRAADGGGRRIRHRGCNRRRGTGSTYRRHCSQDQRGGSGTSEAAGSDAGIVGPKAKSRMGVLAGPT